MLYSEMGVWIIAAIINIYALSFAPEAYDQTSSFPKNHKLTFISNNLSCSEI